MTKKKDRSKALLDRLHERHSEECDKALEALNQGDTIKFEFYRGSASAILYTINDLIKGGKGEYQTSNNLGRG